MQRIPAGPRALVLLLAAAGAACSESTTEPDLPPQPVVDSLTVDASSGWAFVTLGDPASVVAPGDPATSPSWDLGFFATSVMLNGGAAGPGSVRGACLCTNESLSDDDLMALDADAQFDAFLAVDATEVPSDADAWTTDALDPAVDGWYSYDPTTHVVSAAPERVWYVRSASGSAYGKVHVVDIDGATQAHAGAVSLEFAVQPAAGAPFGQVQSLTLDLSQGPALVDLETASQVSDGDEWDLRLEGWEIRVNGGVSGPGMAGAVLTTEPFDSIADASGAPAAVYRADAFGGVFSAHPWYRYNLTGQHQIWPTWNVYLVETDAGLFKVQLSGYYGADGSSRQITFRYAPVQ